MAILTSMGSWNNLLWPMLVYRSQAKFTLPVYLNGLLNPYGNNYDILIAGSMFSIIPVLIVFLSSRATLLMVWSPVQLRVKSHRTVRYV